MQAPHHIAPPAGENDLEGAFRVFEGFLVIYQPTFLQVERYLEHAMEEMAPVYAAAYKPWHKSAHDLIHGVYLINQHISPPDPDAFLEAMKIFGFESAIQFLKDICISCHLALQKDWSEKFHEDINALLQSALILQRQQHAT